MTQIAGGPLTPKQRTLRMTSAEAALEKGETHAALAAYRELAAGGYAEGLVALASMYEEGLGVAKNEPEAARLLKAASSTGDKWGAYSWATYLEKNDSPGARRIYEELSAASYLPAMNRLARMLHRGTDGPADPERAMTLWHEAASAGHVWSLQALSRLYARGELGWWKRYRALTYFTRGLVVAATAKVGTPRDLRTMP